MRQILFVNACVRPNSRTLILANRVLNWLDGEVEEVDLPEEKIQPMDGRAAEERDKAVKADAENAYSLRYVRQFASADEIVIAAPYWDLSFPAMLKAYMEAVTVNGISFCYTEEGVPMGLCKAKELIYVTTAGGTILEPDYGFGYIEALAKNFYGIPKVHRFCAENLDIVGANEQAILEEAMEQIDSYPFSD